MNLSKLHKNILYNFIGQFYLSILAIVMAPIYVKYLGLESYGLIGFFTVVQSCMQLFDLGFSATLTRQSAQYCNGSISAFEYRCYFKSVQFLFVFISILLLIISFFIAYNFSDYWIKVENLTSSELRISLILIFSLSIIRWQQGLYRGVINGFEHQEWLNKFNIIFATIKYIGVLFVLKFFPGGICTFFYYQTTAFLIEFIILIAYTFKILPTIEEKIVWKFKYIQKNMAFSLSVAFTSSVWVLVTQLDKLILTKYLTMQDYACYTLAVAVASGINILITPISVAILPRFSALIAKHDIDNFIDLYRKTTRFLVVIITPVVMIFSLAGYKILFAWTNSHLIASQASGILRGYAIGNEFLAIVAMPYYLQFAYGKLRLHVIGNLLMILFLMPSIIYFTSNWGGVGASYAWILSNFIYLLLWIPVVHKQFLNYSHYDWLFKDVLQLVLISGIVSWVLIKFMMLSSERFFIIFEAGVVIGISIILNLLINFKESRKFLWNTLVLTFKKEKVYD